MRRREFISRTSGTILGTSLGSSVVIAGDESPRLIGRWKLSGDATDSSGTKAETTNRGVAFDAKGPDGKAAAATFNGRDNHLSVKPAAAYKIGTGDFTVALWVHTAEKLDDDLGDLVTMFDEKKRVGFNLSLRNNTGVTTCQPNSRQLQFGIDAGTVPTWADEGRPGNATVAFGLAVHDGKLYAGTAAAGKADVGHVYRYEGPGKWSAIGAPDASNAVTAIATHGGHLIVGTAKYRFAGSALAESENTKLGGGIYRLEAGKFTNIGRLPDTEAIGGLVEFRGRLFATSLYKPAGFYRYEADGRWTAMPLPEGKRVESLGVFNGALWAGSYDGGHVYRFDGTAWKDFGVLGKNTQTYSFAIHRGQLCVGTWPSGRVFRLAKDDTWEDLGRLGEELEVMGMLVHNGQLYAGTLPLAEVYRYDGEQKWTKVGRLDRTPDVKYRRAWTMAQFQGRLFCSTLPSGHIHSMTAGLCVTHDRELAAGWRHVAAVRQGVTLRLYVDGKLIAEVSRPEAAKFNLTSEAPLLIGAGAGDFFHGAMSDVRLYAGALPAAEIERLARRPG